MRFCGRKTLYVIKLQRPISDGFKKQQLFPLKASKYSLPFIQPLFGERRRMREITSGYFPRWRTAHSQALSTFQRWQPRLATELNFPPREPLWMSKSLPEWSFTKSNACGLPTPPPPILGQNIDRCINNAMKTNEKLTHPSLV